MLHFRAMVVRFIQKPDQRLMSATILSFSVGLLLLVVKFTAYALTGSAAILSDATESIVNVLTAAFAFYSMRIAIKPPDECHPYGHGKIEFFSAAFEGGAIIVAAIWIIYKAVSELVMGSEMHQLDVGLWLVVGATIVNALLGLWLLRLGRRNGSLILTADGKHLLTDVITSLGVIGGLVAMALTGWYVLDAIVAILVAISIIHTGVKLLHTAATGMMDASPPEYEAIIKAVLDRDQPAAVCGYHQLRHRLSGGMHFVDFHLIFPAALPIERAHAIATEVEGRIAVALGDAGVMAHIEPCRNPQCPKCGGGRDR